MQEDDLKTLNALVDKVKWDIVEFISKKYGYSDWGQASIQDEDDKKLVNVILGIDDAMEYENEYKSGNFEYDRFYAKFERRLSLVKDKNFKSIIDLLEYKKQLKENYKKWLQFMPDTMSL